MRGHCKGGPGRHVGLEQSSNHVDRWPLGCQHQVDAGGSAKLGQAHKVLFHFKPANHHEIGQLIHYQYQEWHLFFGAFVVALYVPGSDFFHQLVATEHLPDQTTQRGVDLFSVDDHGANQMRDAVKRS